MTMRYTGNAPYCYTNCLHMALRSAGMGDDVLPTPGFIEALTTMPFGAMYLALPDQPLVFLSSPAVNPDLGLARALDAMGWECDDTLHEDEHEAFACLREATTRAPVLVGPLDMEHLTYDPACEHKRGGDHFVLALAVRDDHILVHDPQGFPCALAPLADFGAAWRAESVGYRSGAYRMRGRFRRREDVSRAGMIAQTLPHLRPNLAADPGGPTVYGGIAALARLASDLRGDGAGQMREQLAVFVLPLAARRFLDAAGFLDEAGRPEAARLAERAAVVCGTAHAGVVHRRFAEAADGIDALAGVIGKLTAAV